MDGFDWVKVGSFFHVRKGRAFGFGMVGRRGMGTVSQHVDGVWCCVSNGMEGSGPRVENEWGWWEFSGVLDQLGDDTRRDMDGWNGTV